MLDTAPPRDRFQRLPIDLTEDDHIRTGPAAPTTKINYGV